MKNEMTFTKCQMRKGGKMMYRNQKYTQYPTQEEKDAYKKGYLMGYAAGYADGNSGKEKIKVAA